MEATNDNVKASSGSDINNLYPSYDMYDKPALINILSTKDEVILQKTECINRLRTELQALKESNTKLNEEIKKLRWEPHADDVEVEAGFEDKPMPDWSVSSDTDMLLSISDVVRATAEAEFQPEHPELPIDSDDSFKALKTGANQSGDPNSEYVFDSASGYYYHPPTGYYWDPNSGLFYDYTTCTYYHYDEASKEYTVYSQPDMESQNDTKKTKHSISSLHKSSYVKTLRSLERNKRIRKKLKKSSSRKSKGLSTEQDKSNDQSKPDDGSNDLNLPKVATIGAAAGDDQDLPASDGETSGSLASDESELMSDPESGEIISSSSSDGEIIEERPIQPDTETMEVYSSEQMLYEEAMAENYPPCIRIIVQESDRMSIGTLFIVTCLGGTLGRDTTKNHIVDIPDLGVSKNHARIEYDTSDCCYKVIDLGSQNGTWVNGRKVSQLDGSKHSLAHGDELDLGISTKLLLHIHKGNETCEDCEPGLVQAKQKALNSVKNTHVVMTKEERRQHQKKELKNIKKKYGLQNCYFENSGAVLSDQDYADKAHLRRKFIGSENDIAKPETRPASVHCPIAASNKGHKLLAKMGWKEGQGLGKSNAGISEPITVGLRLNQSSGLGSGEGLSVSLDNVQNTSKAKRWSQARQRFHQLQQSLPTPCQVRPTDPNDRGIKGDCDVATADDTSYSSENFANGDNNKKQPSPPVPPLPLRASSSPPLLSPPWTLMSATSLSVSTNWSTNASTTQPSLKPQIKWHRGETETLASPGHSQNKDS